MTYDPAVTREPFATVVAPTAIAPTTTEQAYSMTPGLTIPAGTFTAGKRAVVKVRGIYTTALAIGSITFRLKLGSTIVGTGVASTLDAGQTNMPFQIDLSLACTATGVSGSVDSYGVLELVRSAGATYDYKAGLEEVTLDTTIDQVLGITVQSAGVIVGATFQPRQVSVFLTT